MPNAKRRIRGPACAGWAAAFLLLTGGLGCGPPGPKPELKNLAFDFGLPFRREVHDTTVVSVTVTNEGANFDGAVTFSSSEFGVAAPESYVRTVNIPEGETRKIAAPMRLGNADRVRVSFRQSGYSISAAVDTPPVHAVVSNVLVVAQPVPDLTALERAMVETIAAPTGAGLQSPTVHIRAIGPAQLTGVKGSYSSFDLVVLWGDTLTAATLDAQRELQRWVDTGGTILAFPGPAWASGLPESASALLGVDVAADTGDEIPEGVREAVGASTDSECSLYYRNVTPKPAARVIYDDQLSVHVVRGVGPGRHVQRSPPRQESLAQRADGPRIPSSAAQSIGLRAHISRRC